MFWWQNLKQDLPVTFFSSEILFKYFFFWIYKTFHTKIYRPLFHFSFLICQPDRLAFQVHLLNLSYIFVCIFKIIFWRHVTEYELYYFFLDFFSNTSTFKIFNSFFFQISLVIRPFFSLRLFSLCLVLLINTLSFFQVHLKFYIQLPKLLLYCKLFLDKENIWKYFLKFISVYSRIAM